MSHEELLAIPDQNPPPVVNEAAQPDYIGVPTGYTVKRPGPGYAGDPLMGILSGADISGLYAPRQVKPRYTAAHVAMVASWGTERIGQLQLQLVRAGALGKTFRSGLWDEPSRNAYADILAYANQSGMTREEALDAWAAIPKAQPERPQRAPLTITQISPDELRKTAEVVWQETLGRKATEEEMQRFVRTYHDTSASAQRRDYAVAETGGTVTAPPDPRVAAEVQAETENPLEAGGHDIAGVFDSFLTLIGAER